MRLLTKLNEYAMTKKFDTTQNFPLPKHIYSIDVEGGKISEPPANFFDGATNFFSRMDLVISIIVTNISTSLPYYFSTLIHGISCNTLYIYN